MCKLFCRRSITRSTEGIREFAHAPPSVDVRSGYRKVSLRSETTYNQECIKATSTAVRNGVGRLRLPQAILDPGIEDIKTVLFSPRPHAVTTMLYPSRRPKFEALPRIHRFHTP